MVLVGPFEVLAEDRVNGRVHWHLQGTGVGWREYRFFASLRLDFLPKRNSKKRPVERLWTRKEGPYWQCVSDSTDLPAIS
jgi:hypothetical protein